MVLKDRTIEEYEHLAQDLRQQILSVCLKNGGHLGASLGMVELTIALHAVFDSPREPLVWDVGHQAYAHKLLTGRWDRFGSLRKAGGISGFPVRSESEHDVFGTGHSSTALSAALAMAWAQRREHGAQAPWTVAIVGDGGLTAGLSFEALNNFRATETGPFLLVLNDNQMSISKNVGAIPGILGGGQTKEFFDLFGFDYLGPLDGHDLRMLLGALRGIRDHRPERPIVLHCYTQKGRGYAPAEELPAAFHGVAPVREKLPDILPVPVEKTFTEAFGEALCELAERDPRIVAITAAMPEGTGLTRFAQKFPDRFFDVGIAESHAVTFAAGLATRGYRPVVAIYSTFLQRGLDGVIHDVALQKLPVLLAIDRAGIVGADGPTHHGLFDITYLGMIPNLRLAAPSCLADTKTVMAEALAAGGPFAFRYPRGGAPQAIEQPLVDGVRWHVLPADPEAFVVGVGATMDRVLAATRAVDPNAIRLAVASCVQLKPMPSALLAPIAERPGIPVLVVEDGVVHGGFAETLARMLGSRQGQVDFAGYGDHFVAHGSPGELEEEEGVSVAALAARIRRLLIDEEAN